MKYYKVCFSYRVNVEAEDENEAEDNARDTMLEEFPLAGCNLDEFDCDVKEDEELRKVMEGK